MPATSILFTRVLASVKKRKLSEPKFVTSTTANTEKYSLYYHDGVMEWEHFRVNDPWRGESTGHRWIPLAKASDTELWCFLWIAPEQRVEQTIDTLAIWDAIALIMTSL